MFLQVKRQLLRKRQLKKSTHLIFTNNFPDLRCNASSNTDVRQFRAETIKIPEITSQLRLIVLSKCKEDPRSY